MVGETDRNRARILYVEDDQDIRGPISQILAILGYQVMCVDNGEQGVEMAEKWKPDIILMDLRMPVMDGFKAINQIKTNPKTSHIPIFVVSAWSSKKERTKAKLEGADEFFVKPPDLNQLIDSIERAVAEKKRR